MADILTRLGWSQAYFGARIGVDERTVRRWVKQEEGRGYSAAMAYLEVVVRLVGV